MTRKIAVHMNTALLISSVILTKIVSPLQRPTRTTISVSKVLRALILHIIQMFTGCSDGYNLVPGDTPGWGLQIRGRIKTDNQGCAKLCNKEKNCCSYEYSPTEKLCNLNKDCKPSAEIYKDFSFCVKPKVKG